MPAFPEFRAGLVWTAGRANARNIRIIEQAEDQVVSGTTVVDTDIVIPLEPNAVYWHHLFISYSAVSGSNSALAANWLVPSGTVVNRFTSSYVASPGTGLNTGSLIIKRRPANTTFQIIGGSDASTAGNFHNASDEGTITTGAAGGDLFWRVRVSGTATDDVILRGGPGQTRILFARIL